MQLTSWFTVKKKSEVTQSCPNLCDPMDSSLPGFCVYGIFQARVLERICIDFLVAQMVKHLSTMRETWVRSLGQEDPLEEGMATHSSILAWRIPWTKKPIVHRATKNQTWMKQLSMHTFKILPQCVLTVKIIHEIVCILSNMKSWELVSVWTSLVVQTVKRLSTMWETWVRSLGWEDSLEKERATHSSTFA